MGEKIKDIHSIQIGKTSLMIELNEGYSPSDGRLIHVQNKKYRYLLREKDFRRLSSVVMRSWSEFRYIKERMVLQRDEASLGVRETITEITREKLINICKKLNSVKISYRVLDVQNKLFTFVVKEDDYNCFEKFIKRSRGKEEDHPYGKKAGYIFLYLMRPFTLYRIDDVYIEVYCQLPCASLTPKNWIPLDRVIQNRLWQIENIEDDVTWVEPISRYLYHLCWAMFHNNGFSKYEKEFLTNNKNLLESQDMRQCLMAVFFNYTYNLIEYLKNDDFYKIIPEYYKFIEY